MVVPRYRALAPMRLSDGDGDWFAVDAGDSIEFHGRPGPDLAPLNGPARQNKLRAILSDQRANRPADLRRLARSLNYAGSNERLARAAIDQFITRTRAEQLPPSSTEGKPR